MCPKLPLRWVSYVPNFSKFFSIRESLFPACTTAVLQGRNCNPETADRKWLISHGLSTNNVGSCRASQADPLINIQLCQGRRPPEREDIVADLEFHEHQQEPRPKGERPQEVLLYPLQGETPSSAERDHSTVGNLTYHMCCKSHFYLGPTEGWVLAFSLYLPLCSV